MEDRHEKINKYQQQMLDNYLNSYQSTQMRTQSDTPADREVRVHTQPDPPVPTLPSEVDMQSVYVEKINTQYEILKSEYQSLQRNSQEQAREQAVRLQALEDENSGLRQRQGTLRLEQAEELGKLQLRLEQAERLKKDSVVQAERLTQELDVKAHEAATMSEAVKKLEEDAIQHEQHNKMKEMAMEEQLEQLQQELAEHREHLDRTQQAQQQDNDTLKEVQVQVRIEQQKRTEAEQQAQMLRNRVQQQDKVIQDLEALQKKQYTEFTSSCQEIRTTYEENMRQQQHESARQLKEQEAEAQAKEQNYRQKKKEARDKIEQTEKERDQLKQETVSLRQEVAQLREQLQVRQAEIEQERKANGQSSAEQQQRAFDLLQSHQAQIKAMSDDKNHTIQELQQAHQEALRTQKRELKDKYQSKVKATQESLESVRRESQANQTRWQQSLQQSGEQHAQQLQAQQNKHDQDYKEVQEQMQNVQRMHHTDRERLDNELAQERAQLLQLRGQFTEQQNQLRAMRESADRVQEENQGRKELIKNQGKKMEEQIGIIARLKADIEQVEVDNQEYRRSQEENKKAAEEMIQVIQQQQGELEQYQQDLGQYDMQQKEDKKVIENVNMFIEQLDHQIQEDKQKMGQLQEEQARQRDALQASNTQQALLQQQVDTLSRDNTHLHAQLQTHQQDNQYLTQQNHFYQQDIVKQQNTIQEQQDKLCQRESIIGQQQKEIEVQRDSICQHKDSLRQSQKSLVSLKQALRQRLQQVHSVLVQTKHNHLLRNQEIISVLTAFQEIVCGQDLFSKLMAMLADTLQMKNVRHSQLMKEAQDIHITEVSMMHREFKEQNQQKDMHREELEQQLTLSRQNLESQNRKIKEQAGQLDILQEVQQQNYQQQCTITQQNQTLIARQDELNRLHLEHSQQVSQASHMQHRLEQKVHSLEEHNTHLQKDALRQEQTMHQMQASTLASYQQQHQHHQENYERRQMSLTRQLEGQKRGNAKLVQALHMLHYQVKVLKNYNQVEHQGMLAMAKQVHLDMEEAARQLIHHTTRWSHAQDSLWQARLDRTEQGQRHTQQIQGQLQEGLQQQVMEREQQLERDRLTRESLQNSLEERDRLIGDLYSQLQKQTTTHQYQRNMDSQTLRGIMETATRQKRGKEAIVRQLEHENRLYGQQVRHMRTLNTPRK